MSDAYKTWQCQTCGYIYDETTGDIAEGLPAGTRWESIPDSWICPLCGTPKANFKMVEID